MQNIPFHIAYLLAHHECVVVPGLGAFVVSPSGKGKNNRWGILSPPENFIVFNSEIKHNDGLLANSIAKEKKCSSEEANTLIDQYVTQVIDSLNDGKRVKIPWVGSLYSKDNENLFHPERTLSCNASNYGLTDFSLPYIKDLKQGVNVISKKKNKKTARISDNRRFFIYAGSVAAALVAICFIPTPLNNGHVNPAEERLSSLIQLPAQDTIDEETIISDTIIASDTIIPILSDIPIQSEPVLITEETPAPEPAAITTPVKANTDRYYIIIASLPNKLLAEKTLAEVQSKSFNYAAVISSNGRYRIYTNSFEDKIEAEKFLVQFRKDYPKYANAWLLKQKD